MNAKANIDIPPEIIERLKAVGETSATALWDCHGNWIIKHKALEKIATSAGITYSDCTVYAPQQGQDCFAVSLIGHMGDRSEWSIGEASPKNSKNSYYYAMAEKRAKDRVILKLLGLHAYIYSEEEADEFKEAAPVSDAAPVSEDDRRLAEHFVAVREYWDTIATMKIAHRDGDASQFAEAWIDLPNDQVKEALWVAPSKGGIFTTEERAYLKSNEVNEARKQLIKGEGSE
jgi:hypothetical protein